MNGTSKKNHRSITGTRSHQIPALLSPAQQSFPGQQSRSCLPGAMPLMKGSPANFWCAAFSQKRLSIVQRPCVQERSQLPHSLVGLVRHRLALLKSSGVKLRIRSTKAFMDGKSLAARIELGGTQSITSAGPKYTGTEPSASAAHTF